MREIRAALLSSGLVLGLLVTSPVAAAAALTQTADGQVEMTPLVALRLPRGGNACSVAGTTVRPDQRGLIIVLGHTRCGAVMGSCDGVEMGSLTRTLALLESAIAAAREAVPGKQDSSNPAFVSLVTETNEPLGATALVERSPILAELMQSARLRVVPALSGVDSDKVEFLSP